MKVLVAYATVTGNTEIIARAIASAIPGADLKNCPLMLILRITTSSLPVSGAIRELRMKSGRPSRKTPKQDRSHTSEPWEVIPTASADKPG